MDFKTAIRVHKCDIDMDTGERLSHSEIYGRMIDKLGGADAVWKCVPFTLEEIQEAIKTDKNLNNLPMSAWDAAGGWFPYIARGGHQDFRAIWSPLRGLLLGNGITCFSPSECVCLLKECARRKVASQIKT